MEEDGESVENKLTVAQERKQNKEKQGKNKKSDFKFKDDILVGEQVREAFTRDTTSCTGTRRRRRTSLRRSFS